MGEAEPEPRETQIKEAEGEGVSQKEWKVNKESIWKQEPRTESILINAHIKTTTSGHFTLIRMAIKKETKKKRKKERERVQKVFSLISFEKHKGGFLLSVDNV